MKSSFWGTDCSLEFFRGLRRRVTVIDIEHKPGEGGKVQLGADVCRQLTHIDVLMVQNSDV